METNPVPKHSKKMPGDLHPEEVELMLGVKGLRVHHRTMLMTLYSAGLRVPEVCQLKSLRYSKLADANPGGTNGDQKERYAP